MRVRRVRLMHQPRGWIDLPRDNAMWRNRVKTRRFDSDADASGISRSTQSVAGISDGHDNWNRPSSRGVV